MFIIRGVGCFSALFRSVTTVIFEFFSEQTKKEENFLELSFSLSMMVFKKRCFSSLFVVVVCFLFVFLWWFEKKRGREKKREQERVS